MMNQLCASFSVSFLQKHSTSWHAATTHRFLSDCQSGTISQAQFNTWLVQDYLFVTELVRMGARFLAAAPRDSFDVILAGLAALKAELSWFREKAAQRQLVLHQERQQTCDEYCNFMAGLGSQPYGVQAAAFWAIEATYNQAWGALHHVTAEYAEYAERWGNAGFSKYVEQLRDLADDALASASEEDLLAAEQAVLTVARLEERFWDMAYQGAAS